MFQFSLNTYLELGVGRVVDRRGKRQHVYFASKTLEDGSTMNFTVSRNVDSSSESPPHAHRTQAQVLGDADLDGSTMFVSNASIIESDAPADAVQVLPAVGFAGDVSFYNRGVFYVDIDTGSGWPHPVRAICKVDWSSPHVVSDFALAVGARVAVSGLITGMRRDDVYITVHDVRDDGSLPCLGHCVQDVPALSGVVGSTFCQWVAHQDYMNVRAHLDAPAAGKPAARSPRASPRESPSSPPARAPAPSSPRDASSPYRGPTTPVASTSPVYWDWSNATQRSLASPYRPMTPQYCSSSAQDTPIAPRLPPASGSEPSRQPVSTREYPQTQAPAQAGVARRSPLSWDSEPSPQPDSARQYSQTQAPAHGNDHYSSQVGGAVQAGVAPRSPLSWDSEPSPQPDSARQYSQTQAPAHGNDQYSSQVGGAVQAGVARRSPLSWDSEPSPQPDSTGQCSQSQVVALDGATPSPQRANAAEGARDQVRLPPSPGPHKRSYWQWSDLRIQSSPF